jgi:hypothetical protein
LGKQISAENKTANKQQSEALAAQVKCAWDERRSGGLAKGARRALLAAATSPPVLDQQPKAIARGLSHPRENAPLPFTEVYLMP